MKFLAMFSVRSDQCLSLVILGTPFFAFLLLFWSVYLPLLCIEGKDMTTYKRITTTFQFRLNLSSDAFFNQTFHSRRNCPQI